MLGLVNSTSPESHPYPMCLVIHQFWGFPHDSLPQLSTILLPLPQLWPILILTLLAKSLACPTLDVPMVHNQRLEVRAKNWLQSTPP